MPVRDRQLCLTENSALLVGGDLMSCRKTVAGSSPPTALCERPITAK
jgi:hypothetical protein